MSIENNINFEVNPMAVVSDLCSKRLYVEAILANNPEKKKGFENLGIVGTSLDEAVTNTIKRSGRTISRNSLRRDRSNIYDVITSSSYKKPEDRGSWIESQVKILYDCEEEVLPEIMGIVPECQALLKTDAGRSVVQDTILYKNRMARLWERYEHGISEYLNAIVGEENLEGNGKKLTVSVFPQIYKNQKSDSQEKNRSRFLYSLPKSRNELQKKQNEAYTIAALSHAKVHETLLPYKLHMTRKEKDTYHAFIKFLTDKEIYHRITGTSYFDIDTTNENGEAMAKVYPFWLGYLHRKDENPVAEIQKDINREKQAYSRIKGNAKKEKLYGQYNLDRLSAQKIATFFVGKRAMTPYEFSKIDFDNRNAVEKAEKIVQYKGH